MVNFNIVHVIVNLSSLSIKRATNQSSTISSVWEPLSDNCFLNISDDDEGTLEQFQCVENTFFSLGSIVEDLTVATQVVTDTNIIDNEERFTMTCTILKCEKNVFSTH
jgi:hypothetical protein